MCNEIATQGIGAHKNGSVAPVCLEMLVFVSNLREEEAPKVADVPTGVAQDAILEHMASDFRCQSEVGTTTNC